MVCPRLRPGAWFALAALALGACGGGTAREGVVFTPDQDALFGASVDFVTDPSGVAGEWSDTWSRDLERRVADADAIALVEASALRTSTSPRGERVYHVGVRVRDRLKGDVGAKELFLRSAPGDVGYATVSGSESRIMGKSYVVFLKWRAAPAPAEGSDEALDGVAPEAQLRWHASLSDAALLARVGKLLRGAK